jgi:hypothetical protein
MKKLFLVLMLATTAAQAETYQWTDREGTVHFSESLGVVPANYRKSAEPLGMDIRDTTTRDKAVSPAESIQSADDKRTVALQVERLKERMMKDEGTMTLIRAMQGDSEMQAVLNNPAIMRAVQAGDIGTLINNPGFLKLLHNPQLQEIEKSMQHSGAR